jgi:hypothetical protein
MGQLQRQELLLVVAYQPAGRLLSEGPLPPQTAQGQLGHGAGSARPSTKAAKIARLDTPITSLTTEASLLLAGSQTPWTRLPSRARSCTSLVR